MINKIDPENILINLIKVGKYLPTLLDVQGVTQGQFIKQSSTG